jgi:hypothetical protein
VGWFWCTLYCEAYFWVPLRGAQLISGGNSLSREGNPFREPVLVFFHLRVGGRVVMFFFPHLSVTMGKLHLVVVAVQGAPCQPEL